MCTARARNVGRRCGRQYVSDLRLHCRCFDGHCHPEVVRAIQRQAETLIHCRYRLLLSVAGTAWREARGDRAGNFPKRVAFGNSGAEAIEAALKIARRHTRRHRIIAFLGGSTDEARRLSVTGSKAVQRDGFGRFCGVTHVPFPIRIAAPWETARGMRAGLHLRHGVAGEGAEVHRAGAEVAAIIVEPIQGEAVMSSRRRVSCRVYENWRTAMARAYL